MLLFYARGKNVDKTDEQIICWIIESVIKVVLKFHRALFRRKTKYAEYIVRTGIIDN